MSEPSSWLGVAADAGIACPRRGEIVDLDRCLACNWLLDLDRAAAQPSLRCAAVEPAADGRRTSDGRVHVD